MARKSQKNRKQEKSGIFYIPMSRSDGDGEKAKKSDVLQLAWRAPVSSYPKEVAQKLGVVAVGDDESEPGLIFGSNSPRPARVRINIKLSQGNSFSVTRFANPEKIGALTVNNSLKGTKFYNGTISSVSLIGTSTNPSRKKKSTTKKTSTTRRRTTTRRNTTRK